MTTVELLDEALTHARRVGCEVREDWFDGRGGGLCVVRGERRLLLDVAQTADEQLEVVVGALRELEVDAGQMSKELAKLFGQ